MGTVQTNLEKYLELWNLFEKEIETSEKLTSNTLSGFAKYYEKHSETSKSNDYKTVYDRLKKMQKRKDSLQQVTENTLLELENFYKFLNENYFAQELAEDEGISHWFD